MKGLRMEQFMEGNITAQYNRDLERQPTPMGMSQR